MYASSNNGVTWGEGCTSTMAGTRAVYSTAKTHGTELRLTSESYQPHNNRNQILKRSYKRAINRVRKHGYTWYKGRLFSGPIPTRSDMPKNDPGVSSNVTCSRMRQKQRLTCFTWNAGGLSPSKWDHFQIWLRQQQIDVLTLQESHWGFTSEWAQDRYFCIHSGQGSGKAGTMTLISKTLCQMDDISWTEPIPGRLLHVRIFGHKRSIDIINVYQHVHGPQRHQDRLTVWDELHKLIATLPKRNTWLILGDFNTSLPKTGPAVGHSTFAWSDGRRTGPKHSDDEYLYNLLSVYELCAVNTWKHSLGLTYQFDHQCSRIDHIICKRHLLDDRARDVHALTDFPLLNPTGATHIPMICSLMKAWTPMQHDSAPGWSRAQRRELYLHWRVQDSQSTQLQQTLHHQIAQLPDTTDDRLNAVHQAMNQHTGMQFSKSKPNPIYTFDCSPFQACQWHTQQLRRLTHAHSPSPQQILKAWLHVGQRQRYRRLMNQTSKVARRRRLVRIHDAAAQAERSQDPFRFYQCIRELSPKLPFRRIQLRSETGELLAPQEAADALQAWFQQLYAANDSIYMDAPCTWPFTQEELTDGLARLPAFKALDPSCAPAPFWKMTAGPLAQYLQPYFESQCAHHQLPSRWGHGSLTFLTKPGTKGKKASELRPITLLEPTEKAMLGAYSVHLLSQVSERLQALPQFAYLHARGTTDALHRLRFHCEQVRQLLHQHRYQIHRRANGEPNQTAVGGLVLCLDLHKAFDTVMRSQLIKALRALNVHENLITFLLQLYQQTTFSFRHRGQERKFQAFRGIRQGCRSAPLLWACLVGHILEQAIALIDWSWIKDMFTGFADDFCIHQMIQQAEDIPLALSRCGTFLDLLADTGLTVNQTKTTAVFRLLGPGATKLMKKHAKRTKEGMFLIIPSRHHGSILIRIVSQFSYLGTILSYGNFERTTMQHRIKAAVKVSHQLTRWLHTNNSLSTHQKMKLWYQCVFPCATYGLRNIGMTINTVTMLDRMLMTQLRRIYREPTHLTHLSHFAFLQRHAIPDPLHRLLEQCAVAETREAQRIRHLQSDDILHRIQRPDYMQLDQVITTVLGQQRGRTRVVEVPQTDYPCQQCHKMFATMAQLRRHQTLAHGHRAGLQADPLPGDSAFGVPTCQRCGMQFTTWHRFKHHIQFVCNAPVQDDADLEHRLRVQEFLHLARGLLLAALSQRADLCAHFTQRCILCGRFASTNKGLLQHWNDYHTKIFQAHGTWYDILHPHLSQQSPCLLCGIVSKGEHKCIVLRQYAMYLTSMGETAPRPSLSHKITFSCDKCCKVYLTKHGLEQHMRHYHRALQDGTHLTPEQFTAHCLVMQAVENASAAMILFDDDVRALLSQTCLVCQKSFKRKQDLMRHLRTMHADHWHQLTQDAETLEQQWKSPGECYCHPTTYNRKHQCTLFLQYALLRIVMGHAPDEQAARGTIPNMLLTVQEVVLQLSGLGLLPLLLNRSHMKLELSLCCQICDTRFSSTCLLQGHLEQQHAEAIQAALPWIRMMGWIFMDSFGCVCNPAVHHGTPGHFCPLMIQVAHMIVSHGPAITVPWTFRATDLMDMLETSLPGPALTKITSWIMSRQFERLLHSQEVFQLLTQRCIWCDEAVPLTQALVHLTITHGFDTRAIQVITDQLAAVAAQDHQGYWCSFCGALLPSTEVDFDIEALPLDHLKFCPYITMVAVMLSYPVWYKRPYQPDVWPTTTEVERAYQSMHLRLMQFNVSNSDTLDTLGAAYDPLVECGLYMLSDPKFLDHARHTCLICHRLFFTAWAFVQHVKSHDYRQMDTMLCLHRLQQRCSTHCQFCDAPAHNPQLEHRCPTLVNLATFLAHGSPESYGPGNRYLENNSDQRPDEGTGHQHRCTEIQKTKNQQLSSLDPLHQQEPKRPSDDDCQADASERVELECTAAGTSVSDPCESGTRQSDSLDASRDKAVACLQQRDPTSPSLGGPHARDPASTCRDPGQGFTTRCSVEGGRTDAPDHQGGTDAIPSMGCIYKDFEADQRKQDEHPGGSESSGQLVATSPGPHHNTAVPGSHQEQREPRQSSTMVMAGLQSQSTGSMGRGASSLLSLVRCQVRPQTSAKSTLAKQIQQCLN